MTAGAELRLGFVGAGGFAHMLAGAADELPGVRVAAVTDWDAERAHHFASQHAASVRPDVDALLDGSLGVLVIATPPATHAALARAGLEAGLHVFCEKPLAITTADAESVQRAVRRSGRVLVVDHVLRYNPLLRLLNALRALDLLDPVQRLAVENDASDERLEPSHWFWDKTVSGGILLEHGVHFFDAAQGLTRSVPERVQAMRSARADGRTDTVVATVGYASGALATFAHGFSHADRCERQLIRVDFGFAEARLYGWIPLRAELDIWADDASADALQALPQQWRELSEVPGFRWSGAESLELDVARQGLPGRARGRGEERCVPHRVRATVELGSAAAKLRVYRESVRAALSDLVHCARTGAAPAADVEAGLATVRLAAAATESARSGRTVALRSERPTPIRTERTVPLRLAPSGS